MERGEARKLYEERFREFMVRYPRRIDHRRAYEVFLDLILDEGVDADYLIAKAAAYAGNVDPQYVQYIPSPRTWLRDRRFEDEDIFTDRKVSVREWFLRAYREGDVQGVERRWGFVYPDPAIPAELSDMDQIGQWCSDDRRRWIGEIARHVLHREPLP